MYLEKIELQGFKSFAKRTILEFQKSEASRHSVTVIVGPNGSGKSNIADAIKWVLGEQSIKSVRGKKAEDVIFSGSEKKSRLGFAEVSLYLNNENRTGGIEYSEIVITRRLYRDGNSEYLLNKNPVRLFDIQLLIARAHFGQKSFSIISQGMIDSVLLATPLERKAFFDEAVGIKEHQIKKHQALNKLERSEEHLAQAKLLLQELAPSCAPLPAK
jgi:chromosome segregation protein